MAYDQNFDAYRLNQLAKQFLADCTIKGRVLFFSESDDNRLDYATWQFESTDYNLLNESGFKYLLMALLDNLLEYRFEHRQPNASQGVVTIDGSNATIDWLPIEAVEAIREANQDQGESTSQ